MRKKQTAAEKKRAASKKAREKKAAARSKAVQDKLHPGESAFEKNLAMEHAIDGPEHIAKLAEATMVADQAEIPPVEKKLIEGLEVEKAAEPETRPVILLATDEEAYADLELTEEFQRAVLKAMDLFAPFIVYERDKPEEARLMLFPAYMHVTEQAIAREIVSMYSTVPPEARELDLANLEDLKLIHEGIQDSISILKLRTKGAFPTAGQRALRQIEYEVLLDLAVTETRLFYRIQSEDLLVGYIRISSEDLDRVSNPPGTRIRTWLPIQRFTRLFYTVLADESLDDEAMVTALIQESDRSDRGYAKYFRRWREAGLI